MRRSLRSYVTTRGLCRGAGQGVLGDGDTMGERRSWGLLRGWRSRKGMALKRDVRNEEKEGKVGRGQEAATLSLTAPRVSSPGTPDPTGLSQPVPPHLPPDPGCSEEPAPPPAANSGPGRQILAAAASPSLGHRCPAVTASTLTRHYFLF